MAFRPWRLPSVLHGIIFTWTLVSIKPCLSVCGRNLYQVLPLDGGKDGGSLAIAVCSPTVVRLVRARSAAAVTEVVQARESFVVQPGYGQDVETDFDVFYRQEDDSLLLQTSALQVIVEKTNSTEPNVTFRTRQGKLLTRECRSCSSKPQDESSCAAQSWQLQPREALYGGGQYVNGLINYRGAPVLGVQSNTESIVPFFTSTQGYGILWDHYGITHLNPPGPEQAIPLQEDLPPVLPNYLESYEGDWTTPSDGVTHWLYVVLCSDSTFACNQSFDLFIDGAIVCRYDLRNQPSTMACRLDSLEPNHTYNLRLETNASAPQLYWMPMDRATTTTLVSKNSDYSDYYFVAGNENDSEPIMDSVIRGYRQITGSAALFPRKVFGFWQCKEHYHTRDELLQAAQKFRDLGIPVDNIVQDWLYWGDLGWGPHWDATYYPEPKSMVEKLHEMHYDFMISVWPRFDPKTDFYKEFNRLGLMLNNSTYFDAWSPAAQAKFFRYAQLAHFDIGVDYLWLDATEPEGSPQLDQETYYGDANAFFNTYSLQMTKATHDGLKLYDANRRVFSLTRSSFAGQQRYGASIWSGDITGSWESLRRQISMLLNYQLSGIPFWSMDIGGFFRPADQYNSTDYHELLIRWFQFGVFCPIMRVHGSHSDTELWNYGNETQQVIVDSAIRLRYRLLDYIYSGFARVEREDYTMVRAMVFDYGDDAHVWDLADQFLFGDNLLVAPVYSASRTRTVYLPFLSNGARWFDFYTGYPVDPGQHILKDIPIDQIPLFVRSSLLLLSPPRQHALEEFPEYPVEVRIYAGQNNTRFDWYQDDGTSASAVGGCWTTLSWDAPCFTAAPPRCDSADASFRQQLRSTTMKVVLMRGDDDNNRNCNSNGDDSNCHQEAKLLLDGKIKQPRRVCFAAAAATVEK